MPTLKYLLGYPPELLAQVRVLLGQKRLGIHIQKRHPQTHAIVCDRSLYAHVNSLKSRFMRNAPPLSKVTYDNKLHVIHQALGTHTAVSRVQGHQLKAKREIRIAAVFKQAPATLLNMIVVHELAHLKEREHNKAFYALCEHMLAGYAQLELDTRLWLTARELEGASADKPSA